MKKILITILFTSLIFPHLSWAETIISSPQNVSISASREQAIISWKNPSIANFSRTVVFSSTIPIESYFSYKAVESLCDKIYEGDDETTIANNLAPNLPYYFIVFSVDTLDNYSKAVVVERKENLNEGEVVVTENKETPKSNLDTPKLNSNGTLAGATANVVNEVSFNEAEIVYNYNNETELKPSSENKRLSLFIIVKSPHDLSSQDKNAITYFIDQGTPTTILLGSGERAGVLNSYLSVFDKLPRNILEWQDVIKVANGRWPNQRNTDAEEKASSETFSSIYQRKADVKNPFDSAAITVIAYGLRPAQRNLESEKNAIKIYRAIFHKSPIEAYEWDMVRAIAYSGATR